MSSQSHPENPFRGLRPFEQEDQDKLFGRDLDLILMKDRIFSCRTTLLFAGSGVGKTSFLNAKVIPALKNQYCVIWHNRWTGADERNDDEIWDDSPRFKIWPPQAFAYWLTELLVDRLFRRRRVAPPPVDSLTSKTADKDDKLVTEVRRVISQRLRAEENGERLSQVLADFRKSVRAQSLSGGQQKNCILILDQFEEVFQYHAFEDYFKDFITDLCEVINNEDYQVRIVFSLREEFLGELSIFDNRIPDLFNNYYRLRHPEKEEARDIILQTCHLAKVEPDPDKLDLLVEDLSKIEKGFSESKQSGFTSATNRFVRRNFVPPPYLQIVCDRLWKEQFDNSAPPPAGHADIEVTSNGSGRFLQNYRSDSDGADQVSESDAQRTVRTFCEEKLSPPFLTKWEQRLAARAFGFLVTRQGAKMAYELNSLARHMDERVWPLKHTLQKLSRPEVRILRESRGPERSYWFELYHDMYAGVVERWKRKFQRESRRQIRARFAASLGLMAAVTLLPLAFLYWYKWPSDYEKSITEYRDTFITTELRNDERFGRMALAYSQLRATFGYADRADRLWAQIWQRRAQLFEASEKRDEALICLLQAAVLAKGSPAEKDYIAQANNLFANDEQSIKATYCDDCKSFSVNPDGQYVVTVRNDGVVHVWSMTQQNPLSTPCFDCDEAIFTDDGKNVATVNPIKLGESTNQDAKLTSIERLDRERKAGPEESPSPPRDSAARPGDTRKEHIIGWTVLVSQINTGPFVSIGIRRDPNVSSDSLSSTANSAPAFQLKAVSNSPFGHLVAAFQDGKLMIWREDGSLFDWFPLVDAREPGSVNARFSPDGRFFATSGSSAQLWEVTARGLLPSDIRMSGSLLAFSSNGRYCLSVSRDMAELWELATRKKVFSHPLGFIATHIRFTADSAKFFAGSRTGSSALCDWNTQKCINQSAESPFVFTTFTPDGKYILRLQGSGAFEKWSVESDKRVGELQVSGVDVSRAMLDGSLVIKSGPSVQLWDIPEPKSTHTFAIGEGERLEYEDLSREGETMLTRSTLRGNPYSDSIWNVPTRARVATLNTRTAPENFSISPGAVYVAGASGPDKTVEIFPVKNPDSSQTITFNERIKAYAFSSDSKLLAVATGNNEIHLIDTESNQITKTFKSDLDVLSVYFSRDVNYLLVSNANPNISDDMFSDGDFLIPALEVWSVSKGERIQINLDLKEPVQSFDISFDDRLLVIQNEKIIIWDLSTGVKIKDEFYSQDLVFGRFTLNGKSIAMADNKGNLSLYDLATNTRANLPVAIGSAVKGFIFAEDDTSLVAVTDSWLHHIQIVEQNLRYSQGILTGNMLPGSLRDLEKYEPSQPSERASYFRWFRYSNRVLETREASFDGKLSKPVLQGDPDELLQAWTTKLGLTVNLLGYLSRNFPSHETLHLLR